MVPREAGRGRSFKGAGQYYLHDKEAASSERVAFTHTENVPTQDPHKALKWMAWTAMNAEEIKRRSGAPMTGRSCGKPVFTFSLAWHPEQDPNKWEMVGAGRTALQALGLEKHEALMVSHTDRPHPHMHVIVNVVDPETGKASSLSFSRKKLSEWAEKYEREHGKIYCDQRVENNAKRQQGEYVKYDEPKVDLKARVTELYQQSDSGAAFQAGLAELGYTLAQGKRPVLIDREGAIHSLYRQIDGVKSAEIKSRLQGLELPTVDEVRGQTEQGGEEQRQEAEQDDLEQNPQDAPVEEPPEIFDRDQQDRDWQESIIDAGIEHADKKPSPERPKPHDKTSRPRPQPNRPQPGPFQINLLQDRQINELGNFYSKNASARLKMEATFEKQYGDRERTLRRDIEHLENVLETSGRLRLGWLKLTRQIPKNPREELNNLRRSLDNIEWRKSEAVSALNDDLERQRQAIEARHAEERQGLQLEDAPHVYEDQGAAIQCSAELDNGPDNLDGPSLGY